MNLKDEKDMTPKERIRECLAYTEMYLGNESLEEIKKRLKNMLEIVAQAGHEVLVCDFLPDVASREQSERATGNEGVSPRHVARTLGSERTDLLPCPFCGSQPISGFRSCDTPGMEDCGYYEIACSECDFGFHGDDPSDVLPKWNLRAR